MKLQVTALLTGRGNNTLQDKNVLPVLGRPLLSWTAIAARRSKHITAFYASSDDEKILAEAGKLGFKPIRRPPELALPTSQHVDAILHALGEMAKEAHKPDLLVVQLANVGTVKTEWLDACIEMILADPEVSAAVPMHENLDNHPFRAKKVNKDGFLEPFFDFCGKKISTNRQDLEPSYFLDHSIWVLNLPKSVYAKDGQPPWTFMGNRIKGYVTEGCFDVHTQEDLALTEKWLRENGLATADRE